jgi:plastocyanin domain-containing protein
MKKLVLVLFCILNANPASGKSLSRTIKVEVTEAGFVPSSIEVAAGTNVTLEVTRKTDMTCSKEVQVPSKNVKKTALPLGKSVSIALGKLDKGEIKFGCGMNMMESAQIHVR